MYISDKSIRHESRDIKRIRIVSLSFFIPAPSAKSTRPRHLSKLYINSCYSCTETSREVCAHVEYTCFSRHKTLKSSSCYTVSRFTLKLRGFPHISSCVKQVMLYPHQIFPVFPAFHPRINDLLRHSCKYKGVLCTKSFICVVWNRYRCSKDVQSHRVANHL
jgi:hypothetical protein